MGLFNFMRSNKTPHHLGLITLYKDFVYWVDALVGLHNNHDINLERGQLYSFCAVVVIDNYKSFCFGIRDEKQISKEFLEEYYQSILSIIQTHYNTDYNTAYKYTKNMDNIYKQLMEDATTKQDWSIITNEFIYRYTKLDGLDNIKLNLAIGIKGKCNEMLHAMNDNFK